MREVHITAHKDGDHLVIVYAPWWKTPYEWLVNRICPCCGITGWLSSKSEFIGDKFYRVWNYLLFVPHKYEKELFKLPIESHCIAEQAIYGKHDLCWEDVCPILGPQEIRDI